MDQNQEKKFEFKDKLTAFYNSNKIKIYSFIFCLLLIFFTSTALEIYNNKKKRDNIWKIYPSRCVFEVW